eukprot:13834892-Alexandrium_andersonii.AAC.1
MDGEPYGEIPGRTGVIVPLKDWKSAAEFAQRVRGRKPVIALGRKLFAIVRSNEASRNSAIVADRCTD